MVDIKKLNIDFAKLQNKNIDLEEKDDKEHNISLVEELYYWEKLIFIHKNNREIKRHCLKQKIKQINEVNKLSKQVKTRITELVATKLKELPLVLFLEKINMKDYEYKELLGNAYSKFMKIKENNYSEETLKEIPNPINYILSHTVIKKQWETYKQDPKYPLIKETNYGKYMEYMYESFPKKFCDEFIISFGK